MLKPKFHNIVFVAMLAATASMMVLRPDTQASNQIKSRPLANPVDRYLLDELISQALKKFELKGDRPIDPKMRLMRIAASLLKKSKAKAQLISKVSLGSEVLKSLGGKPALRKLDAYLNDPNFNVKYRYEKSKVRSLKKQEKLKAAKEKEKQELRVKLIETAKGNMEQIAKQAKAEAEKRRLNETTFKYQPSIEGMPFPQFGIAGINYHSPINITINEQPYPNKHALEGPYALAKHHMKFEGKIRRGAV